VTVVLIARLVLAAVFAAAAAAKLADRRGTRKAVTDFGAPERTAGALAIGLPLAELMVAGLLLPARTAALGALGALLLLAIFSAALAWNLARGRSPDCHCFGQLRSTPASWRTLARNAVLMGVATLALVGTIVAEPIGAVEWIGDLEGAALLALAVAAASLVLLAAVGAAFLTLVRSYGRVLTRLDRVEAALESHGIAVVEELELPEIGLAPGTPVPPFAATTLAGQEISHETVAASGVATLLLFTSPHCGPCSSLMPTVARWQREQDERLTVVVASAGSAEEVRQEAERHGLTLALHDRDGQLANLFRANGTPSAVLLSPDGTVASWVASGSEWIEQIVAQAVGGGDEGGLPVGTEAPALALPSLEGETVPLDSLRGRDAVLLFWNPDCGFCREMRDDVLAWEASSNGIHPRLVVVSSGDAASTRAEGFGSLVLLDEDFAAGSAFDANGTPMAVRLDADGRIASQVVAGADAVLALARATVRA
jgi:thiol-disulfide isomerase/thioredoxin